MMLKRAMQTRTAVHDEHAAQRQREQACGSALRLTAVVQTAAQLVLWVTFYGYDRAAQAVWQSALLLALPVAGLVCLWRAGGAQKTAGLLLLPCLLLDAAFLLYALCGFIDGLIPEYPYAAGAVCAAAVCWLTLLFSRREGVANGTNVLKYFLLILFLLGAVFLRASSRADRLWPILGQGLSNTALTALGGTGAVWGAALLFVLPDQKETSVKAAALCTALPWAVGAVWALWYGFLHPWAPGDELRVAERLMGLARHAADVINYELAGLMWLVLLPVSLTCCAMSGEILLSRACPRAPRALSTGMLLLPALLAVCLLPRQLPQWLKLLLPWRGAWTAAAGAAALILKRRERAR